MKTTPTGSSYDCPVVLEDTSTSSPLQDSSNRPKRQRQAPVICIDSDEDERKMPARQSSPKKNKRARLAGPQTLCRRPWTTSSSSCLESSSDSDDDSNEAMAKQLQQQEWGRRRPRRAAPPSTTSAVARLNNSPDSEDDDDDPDVVLARKLQQEEWGRRRRQQDDDADAMSLEALLKAERENSQANKELNRLVMESDASLATQLEQEFQQEKHRRKGEEEAAMTNSLDGRAWLFVNQVLELHKNITATAPGPSTVAVDDMVFLGRNFLQCLQEFEHKGYPCRVTLAYHYTSSAAMDKIKQDGLMTLEERRKTYSTSNSHGAVFGDGIYTANNPFAFRHFGDTGLLVAVLLGNVSRVPMGGKKPNDSTINTVIGNKMLRRVTGTIPEKTKYTDELVLQESKQCLPLMQFKTASVSNQAGKDAVWAFHQELQKLLDTSFNKGVRTKLTRIEKMSGYGGGGVGPAGIPPPIGGASRAAMAGMATNPGRLPAVGGGPPASLFAGLGLPLHMLASLGRGFGGPSAVMPATAGATAGRGTPFGGSSAASKPEVLTYTAPQTITTSTPSDAFISCKKQDCTDDCVICMESLSSSGRVVRLKECGHEYHRTCITDALKAQPWCPVCRAMIRKPQGTCPSGTMSISTSSIRCSGFSCSKSIVITYSMPSGTQMPYHDNPGQRFQGATRIAYLPDNDDGRKLLKRLKWAWMQGLTFRVGTSLTTHQPNCITWASIHHKTSPSGGTHGFPDAAFFINCNGELDSCGVPKMS